MLGNARAGIARIAELCITNLTPHHSPRFHHSHGKDPGQRPRSGIAAIRICFPRHIALLPLLHRRVRPRELLITLRKLTALA